jgi:putative membrane-bound dehydrogenase-like protein
MHARLLISALAISIVTSVFSAGKELEGERAAAQSTCPTPEEAAKMMTVPEGYEVRCFAHEPMIVNPVAMTWDSRGRLWVVEGYEYPNGSEFKNNAFGIEAKDDQYHPVAEVCKAKDNPLNAMRADHPKIPKDRIVILEDTDNDGIADKRTVFVEGLDMGSAILLGDGGVYVGQQPHLLHFKDTDGDDHADEWRIVLTGFGREDTHELLNSFCWGPDGWLYMTHGVFTNSKVRRPGVPEKDGFKFDAGIGRCRPSRSSDTPVAGINNGDKSVATPWEFEVFADGTSNPWGCDYDAKGNFFVSACVIDHFFHMAPGGIYTRQGGAPENPYAYELLPSIVKHKHFRAAYAGVQIYQGGVYPADTNGHAFIGNIHDNAVHEEILTPVGASFKCEPRRDFLRANNGWFRPVSTQTGPDGNLWIMDWCDKYPCYQNAKANPEGVDRERGRIWRVVYTGGQTQDAPQGAGPPSAPASTAPKPGPGAAPLLGSRESREMDLSKLSTSELVKMLGHSNSWMRRKASRQILENWLGEWSLTTKAQPSEVLLPLIKQDQNSETALAAIWTLVACDNITPGVLDSLAKSKNVGMRIWAARISGEFPKGPATIKGFNVVTGDRGGEKIVADTYSCLAELAPDEDPSVRLAVASALRQRHDVFLTSERSHNPLGAIGALNPVGEIEKHLLKSSADAADKTLPFAIWMAIEPALVQLPSASLQWFAQVAPESQPLSHTLTYKSMRRLCDTRDAKNIDLAVAFCDKIQSHDILLAHALDGLVKGQESGALKPTVDASKQLAAWRASTNADVRHHAQELAVLWGDAAATNQLLAVIASEKTDANERLQALQTLRKVKSDAVRDGLTKLLGTKLPEALAVETIRAAGDLGGDQMPALLVKRWYGDIIPGVFAKPANGPAGDAYMRSAASPAVRGAIANAMISRPDWAAKLLDAVEQKQIMSGDLSVTVSRYFGTSPDAGLKKRAATLLGAWKESSEDTKTLIAAKRKACLEGEPDLAQGKVMFQTTCMVCHSFHGGGQKVGPDLIGSGRSNLDALLANVIDPNQIIGNGYENIVVTTKDNRTVAGRMVEDTPSHVKLLAIGGAEQLVARDQIAKLENTHQSVMPVGFGALPDEQFRNLVWYVLSPPEEGPLTAEKKKLLSQGVEGGEAAKKKPTGNNSRAIDWESVSLWNPDWKVDAPDFERTPVKLAEFHGRTNALLMHPFAKDKPTSLERKVKIGADKLNKLDFYVASHDQGDWELRVLVNGEVVKKETIGHDGERWKHEQMDLSKWAGKEVTLKIEGAVNGWSYEFGYWSDVKLE